MAESLTHNLKLIGRYAVLRELRRERYTAVYLASDPVLNREVILKAVQVRPAPGQPSTGHDRIDQAFTRQAQAAGRLLHPHIVAVFDAGRVQNVAYLALEKVDGVTVADALAGGFRPGFLQAADLVARVADAVEFAHARGIPHGHLGVSRIWLEHCTQSPKVMGFGGWIDTGVTGDFELAATHAVLPYFEDVLAPEARERDLRALGAVLFLLLTGTRPDAKAMASRSGAGPVRDLCPAVPQPLADLAERAIGGRGTRPFASAAEMRDALTALLRARLEASVPPATIPPRRTAAPAGAAVHATIHATNPAVAAPATLAPRGGEGTRKGTGRRIGALATLALVLACAGIAMVVGGPAPSVVTAATADPPSVPGEVARTAVPVTANASPRTALPSTATSSPRTAAQTTTFGPAGRPATPSPVF